MMPKINLNDGHLKSLKNGPFVYEIRLCIK